MVTNNSCDYSPTQHSVQVGGANGTLTSLAVGASNSICQGVGSSDPTFTTTPQLVGLGIGAASTGSGLTFDGVSTMSSYVQGTWTPGVAFGGGTTGITYSFQIGYYTRIGNCVFIYGLVTLTSKGTSTGLVTFTGLPITAATASVMVNIEPQVITFTGNYLTGTVTSGTTTGTIQIVASGSATTQLQDTNFANTSNFRISGFYYV